MIITRSTHGSIGWIVLLLFFATQPLIAITRADEPTEPVKPSSTPATSQPREREVIRVDPQVLDAYVGQYELAPKAMLVLDREKQHLMAQLTGQPRFEVFAESETEFFWKIVEAHFTIQKDEQGQVTGLVFEQGAAKLTAKKISNVPPPEEDFNKLDQSIVSPLLAALAKDLNGRNQTAVKHFWSQRQDQGPLVESNPRAPHYSWVTFLWRGNDKTRSVSVSGGPSVGGRDKPLTRLADTDIWYRTELIPNDARFVYSFQINWPANMPDDLAGQLKRVPRLVSRLDPLNPHEVTIQSSLRSLLELPEAPKQPWLERLPGVPKGKLSEATIESGILKQQRAFTVYTPANYAVGRDACGLLVLFDAQFYQDSDEIPGPAILDNLIAKEKIPPLVVVFVKHAPQNRATELGCSETFADFVAKELVPWVKTNYHISSDPGRAIVGGLSQGGLMAAYCALRHSDVFGNVLSQSGSYWWFPGAFDETIPPDGEPGWLTRKYATAPRQPIRFYLEAGRFEDDFPFCLLAENRRFRDVLQAKGYSIKYSEFSGGHDYQSWRGSFADALMTLTSVPEQK